VEHVEEREHLHEAGPLVRFLVLLGGALILSGEAVDVVQDKLELVARRAGAQHIDVIALPTVLLIQTGRSTGAHIELGSVASSELRLDQVSQVYELAGRAERGEIGPTEGLEVLDTIRAAPPPFGPVARTLGLGVLSAGFALLLQPTMEGFVGAFVLGLAVGLVLLVHAPMLKPVLPVLVSFGVASAVFYLAERYEGDNPIRSLIPPLVIFLPGAAITTGTMELAGGQTISGASRLVEGLVDLLLLAVGIVAAAELLDTPSSDLLDHPVDRLGVWTAPIALLAIVLGNHLHKCAPRRALPWILLVLTVAFAGQTAGAAVFGAELSGFFGALAMTPLVLLIGRRTAGPATMVMFLPAFWMLVPGAAGLIGVTGAVGGGATLSPGDFASTMVTVVAIALGVLLGTAVVRAGDEVRRSTPVVAATRTVNRTMRRSFWRRER
jgi:uncharacterized membrane protein YjjP (DUF1212 family)